MTGLALVDWVVLLGSVAFIAIYGAWRTRHVRDANSFLRGDGSLRWPTIGLSIMATQASAITFISTPGQGYQDGMGFVQFYLGLPIAMIVISAVFVPVFYRLEVRTAYEYLEHRFDVRLRLFGGFLFLLGRGLAAGITIYAPSIILSQILGWPLQAMILIMGVGVIVYTVVGGTQAVGITQKHQMIVMMTGLVVAAVIVIWKLPEQVSVGGAVQLAGVLGRMDVISFDLDFTSRYNFWSGIAGGFFLALSYFGTDQSQVQRYLSARSVGESRLGLLFNGIFKIPMQFLILFTGVMVFVFYLFVRPPVHFDAPTLARVQAARPAEVAELDARYDARLAEQRAAALAFLDARGHPDEPAARERVQRAAAEVEQVRTDTKELIRETLPGVQTRDTDHVFLSFVLGQLPVGVVGLLIAVILCAAMSSVASELIALATTTTVDFYLRRRQARGLAANSPDSELRVSKILTVLWGGLVIAFASTAKLFDNLIQAVNILGSLFYGTILGLFVVALFLRRVTATPALIGGLVAQTLIIVMFFVSDLGFLWFNVIACMTVVVVSLVLQMIRGTTAKMRDRAPA
ncbi:MAG: sodium:solute symporter [Kofleriaceae bacterium]